MILHEVLTTEKVPITYRVGGLGARFLAWLVDFILILGLGILGWLISLPVELGRPGLGMAVMFLWWFIVSWGYFLLLEWLWKGQTPGKRLLGIRVVQMNGTAVTFLQSAMRNLLRLADALPIPIPSPIFPGGLGFVIAAGNRESRRLGDLAAGTLVVHVEQRAQPIRTLYAADTEVDRARQAMLRQRLAQLSREQKQTLLDLCLRRDQLRLGERARLFRAAAEFFLARLDLSPAAYESDEKFVLQAVSVLGERAGGPVG
jgi:uncharacterized RDD family membrane protein YckC